MAKKFVDKVRSATATTGQGTITLSGAYDASFFSLAEAMVAAGAVDGDTTDYVVNDGDDFEIVRDAVIGGSGTTVTRGTTVRSKIGGVAGTTKLTLSGAAQVRFFPTAESLNALVAGIDAKLDKTGGTMTGALLLAGDATLALHPVTKQQLDAIAANVGKRGRVRAATVANITISTALNNGDTLDGVTLVTGDLVLVKNQTSAQQNGVYVVGVSPARAAEFDTYNEHPGSLIAVQEGGTNGDTVWICTSNDGGTLDTTAIDFAAFTALTAASIGAVVNSATSKSAPADGDKFGFWDSVGSAFKQLSWSELKTALIAAFKSTAAFFWAGTNDATFLTPKNVADASARVVLTSGTTIATDASLGRIFYVVLGHNATFSAPTNLIDGVTYTWIIKQDATGNRTGAFNSIFRFPSAPTLSTVAGSVDIVSAIYNSTDTKLEARFSKGS